MEPEIYLDSAAGTPPHPAALEALAATADAFGDPLRMHAAGRRARAIVDEAHEGVAEVLGTQADEIVLTSGGTESVALALRGVARAAGDRDNRIVVSAVEHPSVLGAAASLIADGFEVVEVPVDADGRIDLDFFVAEVRKPRTLVASIQHSNHEIGTLQPVAEVARLAREAGVLSHTDACQSVGRLPIDVGALGVDMLTLSAHKSGGVSGAGALYVRRGVPLASYPFGDHRERRRRAGLENVPGIAAMAAALRASRSEVADLAAHHWALTEGIRRTVAADVPGAEVHGHPTQRATHLVAFSVDGVDPEVLLMALDERGFRVGIGGCATGLPHEPSHVLAAMGRPGRCPIRVGVTRETTDADVDGFLTALVHIVGELRRMDAASAETLGRRSAE